MEWFWAESIWLPPDVKWSHLSGFSDLPYSLITAIALLLIRYISEKLIFRKLAFRLLDTRTGGDHRRPKLRTIMKFSEGMWRFSFYLFASIYGWCVVLWDKPYSRDTKYCLINYPHHPVTTDEWWYYNIELGFYISLIVTQFIDTRRKDFWQMFAHHVITVLLLVLSWACNFHRIGALVLAIHDIADVPMEGAKLAKYCQKQRLADALFALFTLTWIYTRCYLLPTRVIYYTTYEALSIIPFFPAYYIFNGLLCLLQVLHLAWTWLIFRIVFYAVQNSGMRDLRSDSE